MANCVDCGKTIGQGQRCVKDRGLYLKRRALVETATTDRDLLEMLTTENLNAGRIGVRLGISRTGARRKIMEAQRREKDRVALGI